MKLPKFGELRPRIAEVWRLSLPAILAQITTIAMQYIDSAMVGALGAGASAAIGLVSSTTWVLQGVSYGVSAGFSVQVAHNIGAEKDADARKVVCHGYIVAALVSLVVCIIGLVLCKPLPVWLGGEEAIRRDASLYFLLFVMMIPFFQLNNLSSSYLQCSGDMLTPSILNAVMCVLDVVFNSIFIPLYGVLGAGIGTTLACAVVSLVMTWFCCRKNPRLRLRKEKLNFDFEIVRKAVKVGTPVALEEVAMCGAMVVSTAIIAPLGTLAIAAHSFAVTAEGFCYMPGYGIGAAATTLVGRKVGAGKVDEARSYGNICTAMGAIFMSLTGLAMMIACPFVFSLLTPDPAVQKLATEVLRIELLAEPLFAVSIVAAGALRGVDDTLVPSLMGLGTIWVIRLGLAVVLVRHMGLHGMWIAMTIELCARGLLIFWRLCTSKYYDKFRKAETTG